MMGIQWFVRMSKWARHPPSPQKVKLVIGVIAACLLLFAVEHFWGWPQALTVNKLR